MFRRLLLLIAVPVAIACGDSTAPEPTPDTDALPDIPRPVSLNDFGATKSEVQTEIRPLTGDFNPQIDVVNADWAIVAERVGGQYNGEGTPPRSPCPAAVFEGHAASDRLANAVAHQCDIWMFLGGFGLKGVGRVPAGSPLVPNALPRRVLWLDGAPTAESVTSFANTLNRAGTCTLGSTSPCTQTDEVTYTLKWPQVTNDVYVRRDRWWERRPLLGDGSDGFILEGPVTRTVSFSYSSGSSTTKTEEFGRSITVEAGGSWGFFSASVSATLSQTFTTSVEVRHDTTVAVSEELTGEPNVARVMTFWVLVERYSITDANGDPYTDDNYEIQPVEFTDEGRITALLATDFPTTGGTP